MSQLLENKKSPAAAKQSRNTAVAMSRTYVAKLAEIVSSSSRRTTVRELVEEACLSYFPELVETMGPGERVNVLAEPVKTAELSAYLLARIVEATFSGTIDKLPACSVVGTLGQSLTVRGLAMHFRGLSASRQQRVTTLKELIESYEG